MSKTLSEFKLGDSCVRYILNDTGNVGLIIVPGGMEDKISEKKSGLVDSLIQVKVLGDDFSGFFANGHTMRNSESVYKLKYDSQRIIKEEDSVAIITVLRSETGHSAEHRLTWYKNYQALEIETIYKNFSKTDISLEMLSSFSLCGITPFDEGEAPNSLIVHRMKSKWSNEGRLETIPVEDLQLEPSWARYGVHSERFGQVGSMPVRKYFPLAAVEDIKNKVTWGIELACASSWQIELYRKDNALCVSGGLADYEFGHWMKTLKPGEELVSPKAYVAVTRDGVDGVLHRLVSMQERVLENRKGKEDSLPIVYNDYCTYWGMPSHENTEKALNTLKGQGIEYFVMDAGWYGDNSKGWENGIGDWEINRSLFPYGLENTVRMIKDAGMIPGIWFELEICTRSSSAFTNEDHLLKRNGKVITSGNRRFWDMRDPWVMEYLSEKVIGLLKKYGFGYLKIDYNDSIGVGCDGAESPGEGLRQHILAVQNFMRKIREEIPDIVIENCSSGGHRLEPSMMELCDMSQFSDAHECAEIPIIAANVQRAVLPRQSLIWAVLRKNDMPKRLIYTMSSAFLGRMCLCGDIHDLNDQQIGIVKNSIDFYKVAVPVIKDGISYRYGPSIQSYRFPEGWQAVIRVSKDKTKALAVIHVFGGDIPERIELKMPDGLNWRISEIFAENEVSVLVKADMLICSALENFSAAAVYMESF